MRRHSRSGRRGCRPSKIGDAPLCKQTRIHSDSSSRGLGTPLIELQSVGHAKLRFQMFSHFQSFPQRRALATTSLVVRQCFVKAEHKGQLRQKAKAIHVPAEDTDRVLPNAFSYVSDVRHVRVEPSIHTVGDGESAWQSCQQLQIVKLPATVVCLQDGAFQGRYVLKMVMVLVPGCKQFGRRVFAECCFLRYIPEGSFLGSSIEHL